MVASIYAACREANVPRTLDGIAQTANTAIFAAKCYRLLVRNFKLRLPAVDSSVYLTKIANRDNVSQKSYRRAIEMLSIIKDNPVSYGRGFFDDMFRGFDEMRREMERGFEGIEKRIPESLVREYTTPEGGKVREVGPMVYGYSMTVGPDDKPE
jgi:hypothetical protein